MRTLFSALVAGLLLVALLANEAGATQVLCLGNSNGAPIATADNEGVASLTMPDGKPIAISGFKAGTGLCEDFLFKQVARMCPGGKAHLDGLRAAHFCNLSANTCWHVACDERFRVR